MWTELINPFYVYWLLVLPFLWFLLAPVVDFFPRKFWGLNIICRIPLFSKRIHLFDVIVAKIMAPCPPTKKKNIWRQSLEEMEKWPYLCLAKGNIQQASASRRLRICVQCRRCGFDPWVGKIAWRRKWQPTSVFLLQNPMDRGAWQAIVRGLAKSQTFLSN